MVKQISRLYIPAMSKDMKQKIGVRVKAARMQRGISQPQLGEIINKSFETISNIERGKTAPNFSTLLDISVALGVPMREFFDDIEGGEPTDEAKRELIVQSQVLATQMDTPTLNLWLKLGVVMHEETGKSDS